MFNAFLHFTQDWSDWNWFGFGVAIILWLRLSVWAVRMWIDTMGTAASNDTLSARWHHWPITRFAVFFLWPAFMLFGILVLFYRLIFRGQAA